MLHEVFHFVLVNGVRVASRDSSGSPIAWSEAASGTRCQEHRLRSSPLIGTVRGCAEGVRQHVLADSTGSEQLLAGEPA